MWFQNVVLSEVAMMNIFTFVSRLTKKDINC